MFSYRYVSPELRRYFLTAKRHPKKHGKLFAIGMIESRLCGMAHQRRRANVLVKSLVKMDRSIRMGDDTLKILENEYRALENVGSIIGFGRRSKLRVIEQKIKNFDWRSLSVEDLRKLRQELRGTYYGENPHISISELPSRIQKYELKIQGLQLHPIKKFIYHPQISSVLKLAYDFYMATNKGKASKGAVRWVRKLVGTYWCLPKNFSMEAVNCRIYRENFPV